MSEHVETAMATAFARAGHEDASAKLRRLMREAIESGGGRAEASQGIFKAAVMRDKAAANLLLELFSDYADSAIGKLFDKVLPGCRSEVERARHESGPAGANFGLPKGPGECSSAGAAPRSDRDDEARRSLPKGPQFRASIPVGPAASAAPAVRVRGPVTLPNPGATRPDYKVDATLARRCLLDTFQEIGGVPLRHVRVAVARAWGQRNEMWGRFIRILTQDMPDEGKIGDHVSDDTADDAWKLAKEAASV